jgi:hypothetical protein
MQVTLDLLADVTSSFTVWYSNPPYSDCSSYETCCLKECEVHINPSSMTCHYRPFPQQGGFLCTAGSRAHYFNYDVMLDTFEFELRYQSHMRG